ncbi:16380_t:CDS:2 [Dentiscutata erythropus]|uniref:16380_t:CDS:1 n=1 Tax=Dentiscutata erythropus TaxID=1348616 RepID=A0A9N9IFG2_9GLOM|nr:16380_t:CDS:2 [Dentiscutata erythropus]
MSSSEDLSTDNLDSDSLRPVYNLIELGLEEYEDNELVLDTVHDLMQFFKQSNCTCRHSSRKKDLRTCYEKVGFKNFFERHFQIRALEKPELELFLKAQLMAFEITNKNEESQRQNYRYNYNVSLLLCKPVFLKLCGISDHFLLAIQKHLQEKGLTKRTHGNTGRVPKLKSKVFLDSSITFPVKRFLEQYGNINGLPSPMRHKNESEPFIYLPTGNTYTSVYNEFKKHFNNENSENTKIISYFTFRKLWYEMIPHLKFQPPASDLCEISKTRDSNRKPEAEIKELELEVEFIKPEIVTETPKQKSKKARGSDKKPETEKFETEIKELKPVTKNPKQRSNKPKTMKEFRAKIKKPKAKIEEPEVKIKEPEQRSKNLGKDQKPRVAIEPEVEIKELPEDLKDQRT